MNTDSTKMHSLDSLQISALSTLALDTHCIAGIFSRNLLIMSGNISYSEPIILPVASTKTIWSRYTDRANFLEKEPFYIGVFPNPANNYFIIEFQVNATVPMDEVVSIVISDEMGRVLKSFICKNRYDQITVPTEGLNSGAYLVTLKIDQVAKKTVKIVISR